MKRRVLVVDDERNMLRLAEMMLGRAGYEPLLASNAAEAIDLLAARRVDLVLTDLKMPGGMSGWEVAEAARAFVPDLRVLFTSGYPRDTLIARGRLDESARMITKPFRKTDLARTVAECLAEPPSRESIPGNRRD